MLAEEGAFDVRPAGCVARRGNAIPYVRPQIRARGRVDAVWKECRKGFQAENRLAEDRRLGQDGFKGRVETLSCEGTVLGRGTDPQEEA